MSAKVRLMGLRGEMIHEVEAAITEIILDPELSDLGPAGLVALEKVVDALGSLVVAASSSNRGYEVDDLPREERTEYKRILHGIGVLKRLRVE